MNAATNPNGGRRRALISGDGADVSEGGMTPTAGGWEGLADSDRGNHVNPVVVTDPRDEMPR
jgi:hypothetical protein